MVQGGVCGCRRKGKGEEGPRRMSIDNVRRKRKSFFDVITLGKKRHINYVRRPGVL